MTVQLRWLRPVVFAVAWLAIAADAASARQTLITGRVTDSLTGRPVATAQVTLVGTNIAAQTNSDGVYTIRGALPGPVTLRVLFIGYGEVRREAVATLGQTMTVDFVIDPAPIALPALVSTATGEQRRVEVGNAIAQIDAEKVVQTRAVANIGDLLKSRAPGVSVYPGTQTGAGVRVRIRGTSSLSLTNNPIYVVDGVRVEGTTGSSSIGVGGTTPSRANDLNPEEIESIEVVRGPSAATLYGTDAANGVIVITTKKGVAGAPQWTAYTEQTAITDRNDYPTAFRGWRTGSNAATTSTVSNTVQCFLSQVASGACAQDSVTAFNLHRDKETTPYGVGYRQQYGLQVRGGSEVVRYFLHGEFEDEDGVTKVPEFEERYLAARGLSLRDEERDPNAMRRITGRANLDVALRDNLTVALNAGYTTEDLRLARSDDSGTAGIAANTYGGPGFKYNTNTAGDTLYGWREFTPRQVYQTSTNQAIERLITSVNANWRPRGWLSTRANFGLDLIDRNDSQICRFSECALTNDRLGFKIDNRSNFYIYTLDAGASATRPISRSIESQTSAGIQYYANKFTRNGAVGRELPPGGSTVTSGAVRDADETTSESRTFGGYIEQRLAFNDRLFLTGAIRSDRNSAFGADFETVFYPKFSASWVLSEEPFFPALPGLNQLRLRTAYGASGVQPGTTDAVQFFAPTATLGESGEVSGLVFSTLGNANLKPERSSELEVGADGTFWNSRLSAEITYYRKNSTDALISRILPPSIGTGAEIRFENLGQVRNWGWEALVEAQLVQTRPFGWSVTFNGSTNDNELVDLGGVPPITGTTIQQREGYPLNGWWSRRLTGYDDKNGNGIIEYNADQSLSEIEVSDTTEFHGYSSPKRELAVTSGFQFFNGALRLDAMMDYRGGHLVYNNTERIRCASRFNCSGLIDPESSLLEQARTVMVREHPSRSVAGFFEEGDYIRFRELSLTWTSSGELARRLNSRSFSATLAARNLGVLWTKYTGVDPEAFGTTGDAPSSFQAFAPPTYLSLRFSLGF